MLISVSKNVTIKMCLHVVTNAASKLMKTSVLTKTAISTNAFYCMFYVIIVICDQNKFLQYVFKKF